MKTMQYLAEDAVRDDSRYRSFVSIASAIIKGSFSPSASHSVNEQSSVLFNSMGWKNAQIKFSSGNEARIILGSNRHLDQTVENLNALKLLVSTICKAIGYHILSREVDAIVDIDIHGGPLYNVDIKAIQSRSAETSPSTSSPTIPVKREAQPQPVDKSTPKVETAPSGTKLDTSQIFLPVLSKRLSLTRLHLLLKDVLAEFCQSWHGANPIAGQEHLDETDAVAQLVEFLVDKTSETNASQVETGARLGTFFAHAITQSFPNDQALDQEIIDGSAVGSIIRDIKARAFCGLKPGDKCGPSIGDPDRAMCDFSMGIWQGCLSELGQKKYGFTGFYPAGKRDPYCLMEFSVD